MKKSLKRECNESERYERYIHRYTLTNTSNTIQVNQQQLTEKRIDKYANSQTTSGPKREDENTKLLTTDNSNSVYLV